MSEITMPVATITDDLIAELEVAASKAGSLALDSAETVEAANGAMIECPVCCGEGYASAENDYCNFDNHAIGVEFYGIGPEFGIAEAYFRSASPATILALLTERAELKRDAERYRFIRARAEGDQSTWQVVEDAAFVSWHGDGHNFDLNIEAAMTGSSQP